MKPILALCCTLALHASEAPASFETRLGAERWRLPQAHTSMDLLGLQLHRTWNTGAYAGFGGWGAVRGEQGGFIALGLSGGWRIPLSEHLCLDTGAWIGGGGVSRAGIGGGLMLRAHAELAWKEPWGTLGLGVSRVEFPNGTLASTQATLSLSLPWRLAQGGPTLENLATALGPDLGWRSFTLLATGQRYQPTGRVVSQGGQPNQKAMDLAGLEARIGLGERTFLFLDLSGAARGQSSGYMDTLAGLGYALPLDGAGHYSLVGKVEGGPAGGGKVDVGGGMAWKALVGLEAQFLNGYQAGFSLGYITTPGASFKGTVVQFQAGRHFDLAMSGGRPFSPADRMDWSGWGFESAWQRLSAPQRTQGTPAETMDLVSLQVMHDLGGPCYAIGQGSFATTGHAGGFGQGMLGLGLSTPPMASQGPRLQVQLLAGAAGGGGINTGGGLLIQPMVGLEQSLTRDWSLRFMGGRCIAPRGELNTTILELGMAWRIKVPTKQ